MSSPCAQLPAFRVHQYKPADEGLLLREGEVAWPREHARLVCLSVEEALSKSRRSAHDQGWRCSVRRECGGAMPSATSVCARCWFAS